MCLLLYGVDVCLVIVVVCHSLLYVVWYALFAGVVGRCCLVSVCCWYCCVRLVVLSLILFVDVVVDLLCVVCRCLMCVSCCLSCVIVW